MTQSRSTTEPTAPAPVFGPGSVTLGVHPLSAPGATATELVDGMIAQAVAAERAGFDGATVSEHHRGLPGYLPQPLLVSGWILAETSRVWSGPNPTLLTLRNPHLFAEEVAWTAARFPGRLGVTVAAGYNPDDFAAAGVSDQDVPRRYQEAVAAMLDCLRDGGPLGGDEAVAAWADSPSPLVGAANGPESARRAARSGLGISVIGSDDAAERVRRAVSAYDEAGGAGPVMWVRRALLGRAARAEASSALASTYTTWSSDSHGSVSDYVTGDDEQIASTLHDELAMLGPASSLVIHLYVPGVGLSQSLEDIERFGSGVLPLLRASAEEAG